MSPSLQRLARLTPFALSLAVLPAGRAWAEEPPPAAEPAPPTEETASSDEAAGEEEPRDCPQIFTEAQRLRSQGKIRAASERYIQCSQPSCPQVIAQECTRAYTEAQRVQPSVTLVARDKGEQLVDVRVLVDGEPFTERLDGRAVPIDPGVHRFTFEVPGKPPLVVEALIVEGEKNKLVTAEFAKPEAPETATTPAREPTPTPVRLEPRPTPVSVYVLGGVGVLALGAGAALRFVADGEVDDLERDCKPYCDEESDVAPVRSKYVASSIAFGAGGLALVTAGVLYLTRGSQPVQTGLSIGPLQRGGGWMGAWSGRF